MCFTGPKWRLQIVCFYWPTVHRVDFLCHRRQRHVDVGSVSAWKVTWTINWSSKVTDKFVLLLLESLLYLQSSASQTQDVISKLFDGEPTDSVHWRQAVLPPHAPPLLLLHLLLTHCSSHPSLPLPVPPPPPSPPRPSSVALSSSRLPPPSQTTPSLLLLKHQTERYCPDVVLLSDGTLISRWYFIIQMPRSTVHMLLTHVMIWRCYSSVFWHSTVQMFVYCPGVTLLSRCCPGVTLLSRCCSAVTLLSTAVVSLGQRLCSVSLVQMNSCRLKTETWILLQLLYF